MQKGMDLISCLDNPIHPTARTFLGGCFLGGMNEEFWECTPGGYISSRATQGLKVIPAAQLKQASIYIVQ